MSSSNSGPTNAQLKPAAHGASEQEAPPQQSQSRIGFLEAGRRRLRPSRPQNDGSERASPSASARPSPPASPPTGGQQSQPSVSSGSGAPYYDVLHIPLSDARQATAARGQGGGAEAGDAKIQFSMISGSATPESSAPGTPSGVAYYPISDTPPGLDDLYDMTWNQDMMDKEVRKSLKAAAVKIFTDVKLKSPREAAKSPPPDSARTKDSDAASPRPASPPAAAGTGTTRTSDIISSKLSKRPLESKGCAPTLAQSVVQNPRAVLGVLLVVGGLSACLPRRLHDMRDGLALIPAQNDEILREFPTSGVPAHDAYVFWCTDCNLLQEADFRKQYEAVTKTLASLRDSDRHCQDLRWSGFDKPGKGFTGNVYFSESNSASFVDFHFSDKRCMLDIRSELKKLSGTSGKVTSAQGGPETAAAASMDAEFRTTLRHACVAAPICMGLLWLVVGNVFRALTPFLCAGLALLAGQAAAVASKVYFPTLDMNYDDSLALFVIMALCVDYALFFWSRFNKDREVNPGADGYAAALASALSRSGRVIIVSNCFVTLAYACTMALPHMNLWAYLGLYVECAVGSAAAALYSVTLVPALAVACPAMFDRGRCPLDRASQFLWRKLPSPQVFWAPWANCITTSRYRVLAPLVAYMCMAPFVYLLAHHYVPSYDVEAMTLREDTLEPQALRQFENNFNIGMLYPINFVLEAHPVPGHSHDDAGGARGDQQGATAKPENILDKILNRRKAPVVDDALEKPQKPIRLDLETRKRIRFDLVGSVKETDQAALQQDIQDAAAILEGEQQQKTSEAKAAQGVAAATAAAAAEQEPAAAEQAPAVAPASFLQLGKAPHVNLRGVAQKASERQLKAGTESEGRPATWKDVLGGDPAHPTLDNNGAHELENVQDMEGALNFWKRHDAQAKLVESAGSECVHQPMILNNGRFLDGRDIAFTPGFGQGACNLAYSLLSGSRGHSWQVDRNDILSMWWMPKMQGQDQANGLGFKMGGGLIGAPAHLANSFMRNELIARELVEKTPEVLQQSVSPDGNKILVKVASKFRPSSPAAFELDSFIRSELEQKELMLFEIANQQYVIKVKHQSSMQAIVDANAAMQKGAQKMAIAFLPLVLVAVGAVCGSLLLAMKLALTLVMPILTTYGITIAVYQMGLLTRLGIGGTCGLDYRLIVLTAGILFGFGMDYDVFLFTRANELRCQGYDSQSAVRRALSETGPISTAAGAMMVVSFFFLAMAHTPFVRIMGFIFFVGVSLDVLVVRACLAPVFLSLAGDVTFWPSRMPPATKCWQNETHRPKVLD